MSGEPKFSAGELGQRCADSISPDLFAPLVKRLSDDLYERLMNEVQDYLCDNAEGNIAQRIVVAENQALRSREELAAIDKALGHATWLGSRTDQIAALLDNSTKYHNLIYAVTNRHDGEDRYQTAMRFIQEREQASTTNSAGAA